MNANKIYIIALLNGAGIMAFELICGKMLAPFYGTSLEVWAVTLAVVLAALALGYWWGGRVSKSTNNILSWLFLFLAIVSLLSIFVSRELFILAYQHYSISGSVVSSLVIIFPFMFVSGMVSPLLTESLARSKPGGVATGQVYSISTVGGVLATFITGYWLIPLMDLENTVALLSLLYLTLWFLMIWICKDFQNYFQWISLGIFAVVVLSGWVDDGKEQYSGLLYRKTGLYGELMVADIPLKYGNRMYPRRMLLNNRIGQTNMNKDNGCSLWDYAHYLITIAGSHPEGSKGLLLGLAGGNIANELIKLGYQVDAVDLDPRVYEVAKKYFALDSKINFIVDDARHFININKNPYDVVIIDLFSGEGVPNHILTIESLQILKKSLTSDATLIINFHGYIEGSDGLGARSVYKTLQHAGYKTRYLLTPGTPANRNTLFVANLTEQKETNYRQKFCSLDWPVPNPPPLKTLAVEQYSDGIILMDEFPILDRLNKVAYRDWRLYAIDHYLIELKQKGLPLY